MKIAARLAPWLLLGTIAFHLYGVVLILGHIEDNISIPLVGISKIFDEMPGVLLSTKLWRLFWLFVHIFAAYCLALRLRQFRVAAWNWAVAFSGILILKYCLFLRWPYDLHFANQWWAAKLFFGYCVVTMAVLLVARPVYREKENGAGRG